MKKNVHFVIRATFYQNLPEPTRTNQNEPELTPKLGVNSGSFWFVLHFDNIRKQYSAVHKNESTLVTKLK